MKIKFKQILASVTALCALVATPAFAEFQLDKYRVNLSDSTRKSDLRVFNTGKEFSSYRVVLMDMEMDENGQLNPVEDYQWSAKQMVRVGPRLAKNITPNAYQIVRVRAGKAKAPGEYRTHMMIEELLPPYQGDLKGVVLRPNLKVIIPIVFRSGKPNITLKADDFAFDKSTRELTFAIYRNGNYSAFGNVIIENAAGEVLYRKHNLGIYREIAKRNFKVELPEGTDSMKGLKLKFVAPETEEEFINQVL